MSEVEEAILADVMGDEAVVLELQSYLSSQWVSSPPTQANPENVADVAVVLPRVIAHRVQGGVDSTPQGQGGKRQRQQPIYRWACRLGPPAANYLEASITARAA